MVFLAQFALRYQKAGNLGELLFVPAGQRDTLSGFDPSFRRQYVNGN